MCLSYIRVWQDGRVGRCSSSPARTPKSQLAAEQPLTGSCWDPQKKKKKNTPHPRTKEKQPQHSWRGTVMFKIKLHTCQRLLEGINKTLLALGPRERSSDPPQERIRSVCECLKSSYGGMGQQWPAAGTGALVTAVLGAIV